MRTAWVLLLWGADYVGSVAGLLVTDPTGCQTLLCVGAAACWLVGPGREVAAAELWVALRLGLAHWWVERRSRDLAAEPRGSQSWCQIASGWSQFLIQLGVRTGAPQSLYC